MIDEAADRTPEAAVEIVPPDASWPTQFEEEKKVLSGAIGRWIVGTIEHIGSTAVPGLAAKPVIDIMAGVESLDASRPAIAVLTDLAYCYFPYRPEAEHWLCKPSPAFRTHHLHLVPFNGRWWLERLAFRNYLRMNPRVALEYVDLKRSLAERYRFDREAYTDAKGTFVERIVQLALREE